MEYGMLVYGPSGIDEVNEFDGSAQGVFLGSATAYGPDPGDGTSLLAWNLNFPVMVEPTVGAAEFVDRMVTAAIDAAAEQGLAVSRERVLAPAYTRGA
jgi:hypothetical protein